MTIWVLFPAAALVKRIKTPGCVNMIYVDHQCRRAIQLYYHVIGTPNLLWAHPYGIVVKKNLPSQGSDWSQDPS